MPSLARRTRAALNGCRSLRLPFPEREGKKRKTTLQTKTSLREIPREDVHILNEGEKMKRNHLADRRRRAHPKNLLIPGGEDNKPIFGEWV